MFFAGFDGTSESVGFAKYNEDGFLINEKQLVPLKKNTFYEKQTSNPCLIKTNDEISCIFQARGADNILRFGKIITKDFSNWHLDKKPFYEIEIPNSFGKRNGCQHPHILLHKDNFFMFFIEEINEITQLCCVTSKDFAKWENRHVIRFPDKDSNSKIYYPYVLKVNDEFFLWYSKRYLSNNVVKWKIFLTKSKNLLNWDAIDEEVFIHSKKSFLKDFFRMISNELISGSPKYHANPCVSYAEGVFKIFCHVLISKSRLSISEYESFDGLNWKMKNKRLGKFFRERWTKNFDADPFFYEY